MGFDVAAAQISGLSMTCSVAVAPSTTAPSRRILEPAQQKLEYGPGTI